MHGARGIVATFEKRGTVPPFLLDDLDFHEAHLKDKDLKLHRDVRKGLGLREVAQLVDEGRRVAQTSVCDVCDLHELSALDVGNNAAVLVAR